MDVVRAPCATEEDLRQGHLVRPHAAVTPPASLYSDEVVRAFCPPGSPPPLTSASGTTPTASTPSRARATTCSTSSMPWRRSALPTRLYEFGHSTAKVTFPSSGMVSHDGQRPTWPGLRSASAFASMRVLPRRSRSSPTCASRDAAGVRAHMEKHAISSHRQRFALVEEKSPRAWPTWAWQPGRTCGGYFVSFDGPEGSAKAIVSLAAQSWASSSPPPAPPGPTARTPRTNIRIAPTFPTLEELGQALDVFVVAVKLVSARLAAEAR